MKNTNLDGPPLTLPTEEKELTKKVLQKLTESGLSKKEQREVLLELIAENDKAISRNRKETVDSILQLRDQLAKTEELRDKMRGGELIDELADTEEYSKLEATIARGKEHLRELVGYYNKKFADGNPLLSFVGSSGYVSDGYLFALAVDDAFGEFIRANKIRRIGNLVKARQLLKGFFEKQAVLHNATPAQLRYVNELYNLDFHTTPDNEDLEMRLCAAWAAAIELIPNIHDLFKEFERRIGLAIWPPSVVTAQNLEALCMSLGYCWSVFTLDGNSPEEKERLRKLEADMQILSGLLSVVSEISPRVHQFVTKTKLVYGVSELAQFSLMWVETNFAKLEVSHKFAASLSLTDIPDDVEVKAPWSAWSFVIPDGLFDKVEDDWVDGKKIELVEFSRAFCVHEKIVFLVCNNGRVIGPISRERLVGGENWKLGRLLDSLVRGACLALSDPEQYKKKSIGSSSSHKPRREGGPPDLSNARYMLTAPVSVDLRDVVRMVQRGEKHKGGKLAVQFLVRGHWKNQPHGPHNSLRKRIWIQPFWKGPEESRVLLRNYTVKNEEDADKN